VPSNNIIDSLPDNGDLDLMDVIAIAEACGHVAAAKMANSCNKVKAPKGKGKEKEKCTVDYPKEAITRG
jgi:hypothetical protein